MIQIELNNGAKMPALGFGTWRLSGNECRHAVQAALNIGYRHIDTAEMYGNESEIGEALQKSGIARDTLFLTTKIWMEHLKKDQVREAAETSLKKLRTDYVDLLLIHWPNKDVPLAETFDAMMELKNEGKAKAIGVSNFTVPLMKEAVEKLNMPLACNQVEYHALLSQRPVLEYARKHGMCVTAYSPLARGELLHNKVVAGIADKHAKNPGQIALRWLIEQKNVAAIPKAASEKNARANFEIFDFALDEEDKKAIAGINGNGRLVNPDWAPLWDAA